MLLDGKTALVTGAANRLGAQIARTLHQNGANLIIHYRESTASARGLEQQLNALRVDSASCLQADLSDLDAITTLSQKSAEIYSGIDVLINNASSFYPTPIDKFTDNDWQDLIGSNLKAPLFLSRACYPYLRKATGVIINMLDIYASLPLKDHTLYCCAKAGNQMLVKSLALEMAPEVRVNGIAPGAMLWPDNSDAVQPDYQKAILEKIPLQRTGSPESIAQTVMFLLGNDYITGEVIRVDGGRLLQP
ncbi:MAG: pteridine reductase [Gammaproteobacteria bacterium]|nr:MAG: pteridine reductase [Gammaproteobacteria bacterium]